MAAATTAASGAATGRARAGTAVHLPAEGVTLGPAAQARAVHAVAPPRVRVVLRTPAHVAVLGLEGRSPAKAGRGPRVVAGRTARKTGTTSAQANDAFRNRPAVTAGRQERIVSQQVPIPSVTVVPGRASQGALGRTGVRARVRAGAAGTRGVLARVVLRLGRIGVRGRVVALRVRVGVAGSRGAAVLEVLGRTGVKVKGVGLRDRVTSAGTKGGLLRAAQSAHGRTSGKAGGRAVSVGLRAAQGARGRTSARAKGHVARLGPGAGLASVARVGQGAMRRTGARDRDRGRTVLPPVLVAAEMSEAVPASAVLRRTAAVSNAMGVRAGGTVSAGRRARNGAPRPSTNPSYPMT